jgi:hypothetical protein
MIAPHSEDKIRKLLTKLQWPLEWAMNDLEGDGFTDEQLYLDMVEVEELRRQIIKEIGFKEPEMLPNDKLKQIKLFK